MDKYITTLMKWVAITVVVAALFFFMGFHYGSRKATIQCRLRSITTTSDDDNGVMSTTSSIAVYVVGAVAHPGVYYLPVDSRVDDAVQVAGGFTASADQVAVNLAMKLVDGMKVYVPYKVGRDSSSIQGVSQKEGKDTLVVNVNMASQKELESIPGIGPVLASRIIEYRNSHGPFSSYEDLLNVSGIGKKTLEKIKPYIQVP